MADALTTIASSVLDWCGVDSPTPSEVVAAELAANMAVDTILFYRKADEFETAYTSLAIELAIYAFNKRGVDGTLSYSENGVSQSFEKGSYPPSMLARIALPVTSG